MYRATSARKITSAISAFLVIWSPQVSDTAESLMACLLGLPSAPMGWNASNSALRSVPVWSADSVSERICTVAEEPLPTMTTESGSAPSALWKTSLTWEVEALPRGIDTVVPPLKSIPKVKPRTRMLTIATATIAPLMPNHSRRRPTTSKAPVPV